jgi:hypothetical protein
MHPKNFPIDLAIFWYKTFYRNATYAPAWYNLVPKLREILEN